MGAAASVSSTSEVAAQVAALGEAYEPYAKAVADAAVDSAFLDSVAKEDLPAFLADLGVVSVVHQRKLELLFTEFKTPPPPPQTTADISSRGDRMNLPALPYLGGVIEGFMEPFDPATGKGVVLMAVAENKLCWDVLKPRVEAAMRDMPDWVANYGPMSGQQALPEEAAAAAAAPATAPAAAPAASALYPRAEELVCATGVSAVLSNLFYCLCEAGDAVLIPSPYYSAFDSDLRAFCDLHREPVPLVREEGFALTRQALDAAFAAAAARVRENGKGGGGKGGVVRALLLTNPHNPLGRAMPREELQMAVDWCDERGLHLVSDEIYALSHYGHYLDAEHPASPPPSGGNPPPSKPEGSAEGSLEEISNPYVSLGEVCGGTLGPRRHVLWGMSKDMGMSGLRFGVLWSQSPSLLTAMETAAVMTSVPGPVQAMVAELLADGPFMRGYLSENGRRLAASCALLLRRLDAMAVPYFRPTHGMFLWIDLSGLLELVLLDDQKSKEEEEEEEKKEVDGKEEEAEGSAMVAGGGGGAAGGGGGGSTEAESERLLRGEALLYDRLRTELRVVITPGDSQHASSPGWFRICFAYVPQPVLATAMDKLADWISALRQRHPEI